MLTPEGEVYYEGCRKLVQRYFALEEEVKTLHEEVAGRVSVASIYSIGLSHMNRFVQRFLRDYPKANVRVQYQHPRRVYELVETRPGRFGAGQLSALDRDNQGDGLARRADGAGLHAGHIAWRSASGQPGRPARPGHDRLRRRSGNSAARSTGRWRRTASRSAWRWSSTTPKRSSGRSRSTPA